MEFRYNCKCSLCEAGIRQHTSNGKVAKSEEYKGIEVMTRTQVSLINRQKAQMYAGKCIEFLTNYETFYPAREVVWAAEQLQVLWSFIH